MAKIEIPVVILILVVITQVISQVIIPGICPAIRVQKDFISEKYLGKWFEYSKYPAAFEADGKCITATYSSGPESTIKFAYELISISTGKKNAVDGCGWMIKKGVLGFKFTSIPSGPESRYNILSTNYDSYAVVYNCVEDPSKNTTSQYAWILTRKPVPSQEDVLKSYSILKTNKISTSLLEKTDQLNCH